MENHHGRSERPRVGNVLRQPHVSGGERKGREERRSEIGGDAGTLPEGDISSPSFFFPLSPFYSLQELLHGIFTAGTGNKDYHTSWGYITGPHNRGRFATTAFELITPGKAPPKVSHTAAPTLD